MLLRFYLPIPLYSDDFLVTNRVLPYAWNNHQSTAVRAQIGYRLVPDSKIARGVVAASVKDAFLLFCLALN